MRASSLNVGDKLVHVEGGKLASVHEILDELEGVVVHLSAAVVISGNKLLEAVKVGGGHAGLERLEGLEDAS